MLSAHRRYTWKPERVVYGHGKKDGENHTDCRKKQIIIMIMIIKKPYAYQCNRSVCRNADRPSIMTKIASVNMDHKPNMMYNLMAPQCVSLVRPILKTMFHSTSDSSVTRETILMVIYITKILYIVVPVKYISGLKCVEYF